MKLPSNDGNVVEIDARRGVLRVNGQHVKRLRPGYQPWDALMALASAAGAPVERDTLCRAFGANASRQDTKEVARNVLRRVRNYLREEGLDADELIESLGRGRWRLNAHIKLIN